MSSATGVNKCIYAQLQQSLSSNFIIRWPFPQMTWYWLLSVLEEELGILAPLTGVPAVRQDIDIAKTLLLHWNSLKKLSEWMNCGWEKLGKDLEIHSRASNALRSRPSDLGIPSHAVAPWRCPPRSQSPPVLWNKLNVVHWFFYRIRWLEATFCIFWQVYGG